MTTNLEQLTATVAMETGMTAADARRAVKATFDAITRALAAGEEVRLVGFGSFSVRQREARQGRNPRTGETLDIAAGKTPAFKVGKGLKDAVNS